MNLVLGYLLLSIVTIFCAKQLSDFSKLKKIERVDVALIVITGLIVSVSIINEFS